ncbi:hypothetical protein GCM10008967_17230 [Bacillus carboniphilus]|uniref:histidine kinase n=1 Tax=Bacillus carboniphilus TaxID=86663 RepID=A0ABN0W6V5_9BACI
MFMERINLLRDRNGLLIKILWIIYIIDLVFYFSLDPIKTFIWPSIGLIIAISLVIILKSKAPPVFTMYATILGLYIFFFSLNYFFPYFINYIFIFLGIILTSLYQNALAIVFSGGLATSLLIYFYTENQELYAETMSEIDLIYYVLFGLFTVIFLLFYSNYVNKLWVQAYKRENEAKEALFLSQEYLQSIIQHTQDAVVVIDKDERVLTANQAFERIFGIPIEKNLGEKLDILPKRIVPLAKKQLQKVLQGERLIAIETKCLRSDGEEITVEMTLSPIYNKEQSIDAIFVIVRDITQKKETERLLLESEKLKLAGEIAAGIAHEVRNPLTVISGFLQMIDRDPQKIKQYSSIMLGEIKRVNEIINEFLLLAKPKPQNFLVCDLTDVVQDVLLLFESECNLKSIVLNTKLSSKPTILKCEPNHLKQVFINLLKNAIEAMPKGGTLTIQTDQTDKNTATVSISDTGVGIPSANMQLIGQPFFTTKDSGTGLGLMITEKIIKDHQGNVEIKSIENIGTEVIIQLPLKK